DREREIRFIYQFHVRDHRAPGWGRVLATPDLVELADVTERNPFARQGVRELHQTVYVPCQETATRRSEIVLLSHEGAHSASVTRLRLPPNGVRLSCSALVKNPIPLRALPASSAW